MKIGISVFYIIIEAVKGIATLALLSWHIYLMRTGITTYQFLVEKEELEKLKLKLSLN